MLGLKFKLRFDVVDHRDIKKLDPGDNVSSVLALIKYAFTNAVKHLIHLYMHNVTCMYNCVELYNISYLFYFILL